VAAVFREQEDGQGYFLLVYQLVQQHGYPLALYHDRHGIFTQRTASTERDSVQEQLAGAQEPTQFGRLLQELAITSIAARSPQAKGRVERLFGTLQDRLVVELREASASTLEQANAVVQAYLPCFNAQFAVPPALVGTTYRPFPAGLSTQEVFCFKYGRTVALDNTVQLGEHRLQLLPDKERRSYVRARVEVHERLDGSLAVYYAGRWRLLSCAHVLAAYARLGHNSRREPPACSLPKLRRQWHQLPPSSSPRSPSPSHPWNSRAVIPKVT
jgi:hypothetical protein